MLLIVRYGDPTMKSLTNALVLLAFFGVAWFGYTKWIESSADPTPASESQGFNCRAALARLADDYRCRDDANCTLSDEDLVALRELESQIEENCN